MQLFEIVLIISINLLVSRPGVAQSVEPCGVLDEKLLYEDKTTTASHEYPWAALIGYRENDSAPAKYRCQGVLLSKRIVVTVNLCLLTEAHEVSEVLLGDWLSTAQQIYQVDEVILNPRYNQRRGAFDIGMLHLERDVQFSNQVQPICLPTAELTNSDVVTKRLFLAGMERVGPNPSRAQLIKRKTVTQIMSPQHCRQVFEPLIDNQQHLCGYGNNATGVFLGGAGLMDVKVINSQPRYFFLVGLDSFGFFNANSFHGFASIIPNLPWIKSYLE